MMVLRFKMRSCVSETRNAITHSPSAFLRGLLIQQVEEEVFPALCLPMVFCPLSLITNQVIDQGYPNHSEQFFAYVATHYTSEIYQVIQDIAFQCQHHNDHLCKQKIKLSNSS